MAVQETKSWVRVPTLERTVLWNLGPTLGTDTADQGVTTTHWTRSFSREVHQVSTYSTLALAIGNNLETSGVSRSLSTPSLLTPGNQRARPELNEESEISLTLLGSPSAEERVTTQSTVAEVGSNEGTDQRVWPEGPQGSREFGDVGKWSTQQR